MGWNLPVVLMYISLLADELEEFFMCLPFILFHLLRTVCSFYLQFIDWVIWVFCWDCKFLICWSINALSSVYIDSKDRNFFYPTGCLSASRRFYWGEDFSVARSSICLLSALFPEWLASSQQPLHVPVFYRLPCCFLLTASEFQVLHWGPCSLMLVKSER